MDYDNNISTSMTIPLTHQQQQDEEEEEEEERTIIINQQQQRQRQHDRYKTIAGVAGNVLEWYDFAIFGFLADVISQVFFPTSGEGEENNNNNSNNNLIKSFAIFGGAFLMRPIGGVLMGYVGDTYGRKRALEISIFLMAFPTFAMGCLPTYNQVGFVSPLLLLIVRLTQGLSVGGQLMSSLVFTLEGHPQSQWGLYGSYVLAAANFGTLLGGIIGFVIRNTLSPEQLVKFGWRIPFLCGIVVSLSGIYLKYYCNEENDEIHVGQHGHHEHHPGSTETQQQQQQEESSSCTISNTTTTTNTTNNPIRIAFSKKNRRSLIAASLVPMLWSSGFYLLFVWMAIYMKDLLAYPIHHAFLLNSTSLLLSVCLIFPYVGILSDKYGRVRIMTIGGISLLISSPILIYIISLGNPYYAFMSQCILGVFLSFWGSPMCSWLVESFDPAARLTSVSIGYNIAQAIVGGLTPVMATIVVNDINIHVPGIILSILALLSLIGLRCVAPSSESKSNNNKNSQSSSSSYHHHGSNVATAVPTHDDDDDDHIDDVFEESPSGSCFSNDDNNNGGGGEIEFNYNENIEHLQEMTLQERDIT